MRDLSIVLGSREMHRLVERHRPRSGKMPKIYSFLGRGSQEPRDSQVDRKALSDFEPSRFLLGLCGMSVFYVWMIEEACSCSVVVF